MAKYFLVHRKTEKTFEILHIDRKEGTMTLRGSRGGQFDEPYDPDNLKKRGYQLHKVESEDAEQQGSET